MITNMKTELSKALSLKAGTLHAIAIHEWIKKYERGS